MDHHQREIEMAEHHLFTALFVIAMVVAVGFTAHWLKTPALHALRGLEARFERPTVPEVHPLPAEAPEAAKEHARDYDIDSVDGLVVTGNVASGPIHGAIEPNFSVSGLVITATVGTAFIGHTMKP